MRRIVASAGGAALALTLLIPPVSAAPAQRVSTTDHVLFCEGLESDAGTAYVFAIESETWGSFADLAFWAAGSTPLFSDPDWISVMSSVDFSGSSVTASFELAEFDGSSPDPIGQPVGTATLSATLTPEGDPQPYRFRHRDGNRQIRQEGTAQWYSVSGTLALPQGISFDLSGCGAVVDTYTMFANQPASTIFRYSDFFIGCFWEVNGRFVSLFGSTGDFGSYSDLFIGNEEHPEWFGVETEPSTFSSTTFAASYALFDATDPAATDPVGTAQASATLTAGARINERFSFGNTKVHITGTIYDVDGHLSISAPGAAYELPMNGEHCYAIDQRVFEHQSARQGPRGKPLPNDAPSGALPIAVGDTVTVNTNGTAPEPEAPCADEFGEYPIGKTAWWTFTGTGGDVTVDTAGSDFDTIVGVYVEDGGGGFVNVACNDDVDSLQARLTVSTDAGVTYYIQAGGYAGQSGTLVLSVY